MGVFLAAWSRAGQEGSNQRPLVCLTRGAFAGEWEHPVLAGKMAPGRTAPHRAGSSFVLALITDRKRRARDDHFRPAATSSSLLTATKWRQCAERLSWAAARRRLRPNPASRSASPE